MGLRGFLNRALYFYGPHFVTTNYAITITTLYASDDEEAFNPTEQIERIYTRLSCKLRNYSGDGFTFKNKYQAQYELYNGGPYICLGIRLKVVSNIILGVL